jgi:magnesium chelatase subunit D
MSLLPERPLFPFTALVGQEAMKTALLLNAISPSIGGVLIYGEKGTAKSTAVRGLAALLPEIEVTVDCPYSCNPERIWPRCPQCAPLVTRGEILPRSKRQVRVVNLPVGATEDRLLGTFDLERAIQQGERHFEPGLLAQANRGILYIDEVNLLSHHLVDVLLDAAASGEHTVEREGVSFSHPARFILIGTMNPEEGELRPQLLDRFGLAVEVKGINEPEARTEVVKRHIAFEHNPQRFCQQWQQAEQDERERIKRARSLVREAVLGEDMLRLIAHLCLEFAVDGLRADIVIYKTARALAAYAGRTLVTEEDVRQAAQLALVHRLRRQPFDKPQVDPGKLADVIRQHHTPPPGSDAPASSPTPRTADSENRTSRQETMEGNDQLFPIGAPFPVRPLTTPTQNVQKTVGDGLRSPIRRDTPRGRYVGSCIPRSGPQRLHDIALDATLRAAAPYQQERRVARGEQAIGLLLTSVDLRAKVRETKTGNLILLVLDASGSMGVEKRMVATKGATLSLLLDAYQRRDQVGLIIVRGEEAQVALAPTNSVERAECALRTLPTGGRTPLSHGLVLAADTVLQYQRRHRELRPLVVIVSDGRANVALRPGQDPTAETKAVAAAIRRLGIPCLVIDTETGVIRFHLAQEIALALGARCMALEQLAAEKIVRTVKQSLSTRDY